MNRLWNRKNVFILAIISAAIGLGNLWRFPYLLYRDGGGSFLLAYFIAILTAGLPLVFLEYGFAKRFRGSVPLKFTKAQEGYEFFGWLPVVSSFVILSFYCVIMGWAFNYLFQSIRLGWGSDPNHYFFHQLLEVDKLGFKFPIMLGTVLAWLINYLYARKQRSDLLDRLNILVMPFFFVLMMVIFLLSLSFEGAAEGLKTLLKPQWQILKNPRVWLDAYGQVLFSLSLATGVLLTYAGRLSKEEDLNRISYLTIFSNFGFEFIVGLAVFAILGHMSWVQQLPLDQVVSSGLGVSFVAFPYFFSSLGALGGPLLGILFFSSLIFAAATSSIGMLETITRALRDKTDLSRNAIHLRVCVTGLLISWLFTGSLGINFIDIIDHYTVSFIIVTIGLIEALLIGWILGADSHRKHANTFSSMQLGLWWEWMIKVITPAILGFILMFSIIQEFNEPFFNYPLWQRLLFGVGLIIVIFTVSTLISMMRWPRKTRKALEEEKEPLALHE